MTRFVLDLDAADGPLRVGRGFAACNPIYSRGSPRPGLGKGGGNKMPDGQQFQQTPSASSGEALTVPLAALEDLIRAPAQALREGIQQLNQAAQRSGLPKVPEPPEPPKVFRR